MPDINKGDRFVNNQGCEYEVLNYGSSTDVLIRFLDDYRHESIVASYMIRNGKIRNPFHPAVYGVGFSGVGGFSPSVNGKDTKEYTHWSNMMRRCYGSVKLPQYTGCEVHKSWHNFQEFAAWITTQPGWGLPGYELDKDIINPGNRVYGPYTCSYVPRVINRATMVRSDEGLPQGVSWDKGKGKYLVQGYGRDGSRKFIGRFRDPNEAFNAYREFKESTAKALANIHRDTISDLCYKALMNYQVKP